MKVLFVSGGTHADPQTRRLFDHVASKGIEVTLAMPARIIHPHFPTEVPDTPWPTPGVRLVKLKTWYSHANPTHIAMKGIPRLISEHQPDIVHCQIEPWGITSLEVAGYMRTLRKRPIFGIQAAESKPGQGGRLPAAMRKLLSRPALSLCDFFVAWSAPALRGARELGLDGALLGVIPAVGIDTEIFSPAPPALKRELRREAGFDHPDLLLVGYVGRFDREKGIVPLVEAFDRLAGGNPRPRLLLLGSGPLADTLRQAAGSRAWMSLHPPRDLKGVARFMRALDILVVPSQTTPSWEEQFGLVTAEAMACAVPVVGSTCGAIPDVIGEGGWIVPEGDAGALAQEMTRLADSPAEISSRGLIARQRVQENFGDRAVARQLVELWQSVASGRTS